MQEKMKTTLPKTVASTITSTLGPPAPLTVESLKERTAKRLAQEGMVAKTGSVHSVSVEEIKTQTRLRLNATAHRPDPAIAITGANPLSLISGDPLSDSNFRMQEDGSYEDIFLASSGGKVAPISRMHSHPYLNLMHYHYHVHPHYHGNTETIDARNCTLDELYKALNDHA